MKNKGLVLTVLSLVVLLTAAFLSIFLRRDSLVAATHRLGKAATQSNTQELWKFISQSERDFYSMDEPHFEKFWSFVNSELGGVRYYEFLDASRNTLELGGLRYYEFLYASEKTMELGIANKEKNKGAIVMVSGKYGKYYSPYFISNIIASLSSIDTASTDKLNKRKSLETQAKWLEKNTPRLKECGIYSLKRGPGDSISIEDAIIAYRKVR
jgi:hypothetical protein